MAKRYKGLGFDYNIFADYGEKIERLGGDLKEVFTDLLEQTAETIEWDTKDAMAKNFLPAKGKYSEGDTEKSIVSDARVEWTASVGSIPLGFDWSKKTAGGFLISGTPRMKPNRKLEDIYARRKYMSRIIKDMQEHLMTEIEDRMGG